MIYKELLSQLINKADLTQAQASQVMDQLLTDNLSSEQIAGLLIALRMKGETIDEIFGFINSMNQHALKIKTDLPVVDTCGTGGDHFNTFNISTTAAFIASGAGVIVGKHHNRSVSSQCGSADVLEALGINIQMSVDQTKKAIETIGLAFCFAPLFHSSMKHAVKPRKELGVRTVFNMLGPLLNPINAKRQVIGVFDNNLMPIYARLVQKLEHQHTFILHGTDGMDEFSLSAPTQIIEIVNDQVKEYEHDPGHFGIPTTDIKQLVGGDAEANARIIIDILDGEKGPKRDIALINAAFAIVVGGKARDLKTGFEMAVDAIDSGSAKKKLDQLTIS